MNKVLCDVKKENMKKKVYSRILTNRMTIVAHKMFRSDRQLHLALIIYRLKRDFGFSGWEIANFTGIPTRQVYKLIAKLKPLLDSEILKVMVKMDYDKELNDWNFLKSPNGSPQGYFKIRKLPAWYESKYKKNNNINLGDSSEKEYLSKMKRRG